MWADELGLQVSPRLACDGVVAGSAAWDARPSSSKKKKKEDGLPFGAYVFLLLLVALCGCCCLGYLIWTCVRDRSGGEAGYRGPKRLTLQSSEALDDFGRDARGGVRFSTRV